jgi:hypothetical protein
LDTDFICQHILSRGDVGCARDVTEFTAVRAPGSDVDNVVTQAFVVQPGFTENDFRWVCCLMNIVVFGFTGFHGAVPTERVPVKCRTESRFKRGVTVSAYKLDVVYAQSVKRIAEVTTGFSNPIECYR